MESPLARPRVVPRLPIPQRPARVLVLGAVLMVAVCGFVYELVIIALGTYLFGNSVEQVSIVLASFVSSMGLGSLLSKPLLRRPVEAFVGVECALALIGGTSAIVLYAAFAWIDIYTVALILVSGTIGVLVGCEIPLLMTMLQRIRPQEPGTSLADLLAADYLGAVIAGVVFPLMVLPTLGQINAALAVGALNASAGLLILWLLGAELSRRRRLLLLVPLLAVLAAIGLVANESHAFEVTARQALYDDPIVRSIDTKYQQIVITQSTAGDVRLFLDGDLQFSSIDEYRYHESLVHPAMAGPHARVLVLGGGDGLAMREVLRYPDVQRAVDVELDPKMIDVARHDPRISAINRGSFNNPRVQVINADAFTWLRHQHDRFDVIIADFPDPDDAAVAKLYSVDFYALVHASALAPGGRLVVQAGSPYFADRAFWCIDKSVRAAGYATTAYHVDVPSFGDWGFILAQRGAPPPLRLDPPGRLKFLDRSELSAAATFPVDRREPPGIQVSTLDRPILTEYERTAWKYY
jgi:spermidine synthase